MAATRWGILSAGKISHDFVTCLRSIEDHEVKVVAARDTVNAKKFADLHGIPVVLDNYEDMAKQDVDVVYCGSLNPQHYPLVKHLLENCKAVLCEKPLTMCAEHTEELIRIARQNKVFLMEAIWSRFLPVYGKVAEQLSTVGEIQQVQVSFGLAAIGDCERVTKPELGGSSLLDIGVYAIHFAQFVFKDEYPERIHAIGDISEAGVDAQTAIILKYSSGKIASLTTSVTADLPCEANIYGSKGKITIKKPFWCPDTVEINGKEIVTPWPATVVPCNYWNSTGLRYEAMHVRECLLKGLTESPVLSLEHSLNIARIMQESADQMRLKLV